MQTGDICQITRRSGLWAVVGPIPSPNPPAERWRCMRHNGSGTNPTTHVAGVGELGVLGSPTFTPGQSVTYWGRACLVVADHGETVRLYIENRKELNGGGYVDLSGETEVSRAQLVAENAHILLRLMEQQN